MREIEKLFKYEKAAKLTHELSPGDRKLWVDMYFYFTKEQKLAWLFGSKMFFNTIASLYKPFCNLYYKKLKKEISKVQPSKYRRNR